MAAKAVWYSTQEVHNKYGEYDAILRMYIINIVQYVYMAVSYTHLDVYKRQGHIRPAPSSLPRHRIRLHSIHPHANGTEIQSGTILVLESSLPEPQP